MQIENARSVLSDSREFLFNAYPYVRRDARRKTEYVRNGRMIYYYSRGTN